jgi:hypothetical protein
MQQQSDAYAYQSDLRLQLWDLEPQIREERLSEEVP